jgi:pantetheine-phosphate adenylyltransferase
MGKVAIYPGSFDPVTNGHLDIIKRGSRLVERLIISVAINAGKQPMFTIDERLSMLKREIFNLQEQGYIDDNIEVVSFDGLLIDYAQKTNAKMILRGLRAVTDFDYEFQMTGMNRRMNPDIETVFLMASWMVISPALCRKRSLQTCISGAS